MMLPPTRYRRYGKSIVASNGRYRTYPSLFSYSLEGQEDDTLNFDGDIQITPFNLKEEQQEGSFRSPQILLPFFEVD